MNPAVFSDMTLQAEWYEPNIGCVGIANPEEILHRFPMPGRMLSAEMNPRMWHAPEPFAQLHSNPAAMHKGVLVVD